MERGEWRVENGEWRVEIWEWAEGKGQRGVRSWKLGVEN